MTHPPSTSDQKGKVLKGIATSLTVQLTILYVGYYYLPIPLPNLPNVYDRLLFTFRLEALEVLTLLLGVHYVGLFRFSTVAIDPTAKGADKITDVAARCLQNTLEQVVLSAFGKLILSTYLTQESMKLIPILVFIFLLGRLTFYIGYLRYPLNRAFGFATTFLPINVIIFLCCYYIFAAGLDYDITKE